MNQGLTAIFLHSYWLTADPVCMNLWNQYTGRLGTPIARLALSKAVRLSEILSSEVF